LSQHVYRCHCKYVGISCRGPQAEDQVFLYGGNTVYCYRKKNFMIEPDEEGWKVKVGKGLDDELLQDIGKAIEEYLKDH
jgi:hypothetical protein